ncbi:MAG: YdiU family protein [Pirellula sp.]|jgi:uncharacterized protein YdiU (UPF0061 family)|nr:YdiU family protein [Pirellula sp.]
MSDLSDANVAGWNLEATYAELPSPFFSAVLPTPVARPEVVILNEDLGRELGLDWRAISRDEAASIFSGNKLPVGAKPIAQAYAGHQFGGFTMLGDGRAILIGEQRSPSGKLYDIQLKGSGPTKYSRRGDGRAAVGPMLREYIISEAMHFLGIPTTRSLAVVSTGEPVYRDEALPGAVLTRVASSHIRVGTFQYFAAIRDDLGLRTLADYTINRHYPDLMESQDRYIDLLKTVIDRQASLISQWMRVGFVHGVMNTDNVAISGESIDFGPCAFLDRYHPNTVFSSIDHGGRYAFGNQPSICHWNLVRFAETLLPLIHEQESEAIRIATEILEGYPELYESHWIEQMGRKLGLDDADSSDKPLMDELLQWMADELLDYTTIFSQLTRGFDGAIEPFAQARFVRWYEAWQARLKRSGRSDALVKETMKNANPYVIPRNHRVEEALDAATYRNDLEPLHRLLQAIRNPYEATEHNADYATPPAPTQQVYQTFCGT